jgi:hypothetical protein
MHFNIGIQTTLCKVGSPAEDKGSFAVGEAVGYPYHDGVAA